MNTCANCNSTEYYLSEGSYYCAECHIQTQTLLLETNETKDIEDILENLNESKKEATEGSWCVHFNHKFILNNLFYRIFNYLLGTIQLYTLGMCKSTYRLRSTRRTKTNSTSTLGGTFKKK